MRLDLSFANYNVKGLHSLVLKPPPGMQRIFFTTADHRLYAQDAVAFHAHHCALWIVPLYGQGVVSHLHAKAAAEGQDVRTEVLDEYRYVSSLREKGGAAVASRRFEATGRKVPLHVDRCVFYGPEFLKASSIHTMSVDKGQLAAWLVIEGEEESAYEPLCWSCRNLTQWTADGLYQPLTKDLLEANFQIPSLLKQLA